jgi:hypothetical protein
MTTIRCWLCGQEIVVSQINLMTAYERYLVLTFLLSLLIRFRQYQSNVQFAWQFPQQWPSVLEVIKRHSTIFLKWTTLLPVAITLGILLVHTICYRLIWSEATVMPLELKGHPPIMFLLISLGIWMICLDLRALFMASQVNFTEIERDLSKGEFALTSRAMSAVRFASFGLFNPRKYVENRVADSLHNVRLVLLAQLRRWSFHTAVRITFGFSLWFGFARLSGHMSSSEFLGSVFLLAIWLIAAIWWCQRDPEPRDDEPAAPE